MPCVCELNNYVHVIKFLTQYLIIYDDTNFKALLNIYVGNQLNMGMPHVHRPRRNLVLPKIGTHCVHVYRSGSSMRAGPLAHLRLLHASPPELSQKKNKKTNETEDRKTRNNYARSYQLRIASLQKCSCY